MSGRHHPCAGRVPVLDVLGRMLAEQPQPVPTPRHAQPVPAHPGYRWRLRLHSTETPIPVFTGDLPLQPPATPERSRVAGRRATGARLPDPAPVALPTTRQGQP